MSTIPPNNGNYLSMTHRSPLSQGESTALKQWMRQEAMLGYDDKNYQFLVNCGISLHALQNETSETLDMIKNVNRRIPNEERLPLLQINLLGEAVRRTAERTAVVADSRFSERY